MAGCNKNPMAVSILRVRWLEQIDRMADTAQICRVAHRDRVHLSSVAVAAI